MATLHYLGSLNNITCTEGLLREVISIDIMDLTREFLHVRVDRGV